LIVTVTSEAFGKFLNLSTGINAVKGFSKLNPNSYLKLKFSSNREQSDNATLLNLSLVELHGKTNTNRFSSESITESDFVNDTKSMEPSSSRIVFVFLSASNLKLNLKVTSGTVKFNRSISSLIR
jgi:hypothetical protein